MQVCILSAYFATEKQFCCCQGSAALCLLVLDSCPAVSTSKARKVQYGVSKPHAYSADQIAMGVS